MGQHSAYADDVATVQVAPATNISPSINDTSTVTVQTIQSKIDSATASFQSAGQSDGNLIVLIIQSNVPNTDISAAISIATTQEPIKTAVESATAKIQLAQQSIDSATVGVQIAQNSIAAVESQTALVAVAQSAVDGQTVVVAQTQSILDTATVVANDVQTALNVESAKLPDFQATSNTAQSGFYTENSNLGTATSNVQIAQNNLTNAVTDLQNNGTITTITNGVTATVYRATNGAAPAIANQIPILTTTVPNIAFNWGSGIVLNSGLADHVIIKFDGTIAVPSDATDVKYAIYSDDGSKLYVNGTLAINNWRDQGPTWSPYSPTYSVTGGQTQQLTIWYYENGGGAGVTLGWGITKADGTGYFTTPGSSAFGTITTTIDPIKLAAADDAKANVIATQSAYDTQLTVRNAAYQAWQDAINGVNTQQSVIDAAQAEYDNAQQNLTIAQQNLTVEQQNLTVLQSNLTQTSQSLLDLQQTSQSLIQAADSLANTAIVAVQDANSATSNAVSVTSNYYAEQQRIAAENARIAAEQAAAQAAQEKAAAEERARIAAENAAKAEVARIAAEQAIAEDKTAQEKAAAEAKAAEDARIAAEQAAKEAQAAADKAAEDAKIQAAKDAQAAEDAAKAEADAKAKAEQDAALAEQKAKDEATKAAQEAANAKAETDKQKAEADRIAAEQAAKDQAVKDSKAQADAAIQAQKDAQTKADAQKAAEDKAKQDAIGVKPNSPDQLSDTVVKEAPKEVLITHIQMDVKGVENGGIEFFGTKSAPQVVGEDGKLTPPAPPPGSGLPIPPEAITTQDTFIGQPGGTSFNAPDIAVPVILTPVTGALASVPGVQAVNQAFVAMANIGNDMSPVTRKKAKKILVTTIVVGQIAALRRRFGR